MFNMKAYQNQWQKEHREERNEYLKQWRKDNPKRTKKHARQNLLNNREKINEYRRQYLNNKYKTDIRFNLNNRMTKTIRTSLKNNKNGKHWELLVGYTLNYLIKRLKSTVPKGYTWQDYLEGKLHIDHIIPISVFNFTKSNHIDFKRCWALKNLRLLPARENIIKGNKLNKVFQPTLKICIV